MGDKVSVGLDVEVKVKVNVGVLVMVKVEVGVPVSVGVLVGPLGVFVIVGVEVNVKVNVGVNVRVSVNVGVFVWVNVFVGVDVTWLKMGLTGTAISLVQPAKKEIPIKPVKTKTEKISFKNFIAHLLFSGVVGEKSRLRYHILLFGVAGRYY